MNRDSRRFDQLSDNSMDIIKDKPWAEDMLKRLQAGLTRAFLNWVAIVTNLSDNDENLSEWVKIFEETHEETCCELVVDMEALEAKVMSSIETHLDTLKNLCKTLRVDVPCIGPATRGLYQEHMLLKNMITEYEQIAKSRRDELDAIVKRQQDICECLGIEPVSVKYHPLPSAEEIEKIQEHILMLEEEKFRRMEMYCNMKQEILRIINDLQYKPSTKFETELVQNDDFKVTADNMQLLKNFHRNMLKENQNVKEEISMVMSKIENLWNILDIDLLDRESFRQKYKDNSIPTLAALKQELSKCDDLKKANIKIFIEKLRNQLKDLWDKCHCNEDEMDKFQFWSSDYYTEDLLSLYELEIEKWERYYEENKETLQLIEKHKQCWNQMILLEQKSADPTRFNNRGGQLLKEEKERNTLAKKIPVMEEKLMNMAEKYESHHGVMFKTFGQNIPEYLDNLHADRENAKKQKSSARKNNNLATTTTPMKSTMCLFPSSTTMNSAPTSKRKILGTPNITQKKLKLTCKTPVSESASKKKLIIPKITVTTTTLTKRLSAERKGRLEKRRKSTNKKKKQAVDTTSSEYGDFVCELSERNDCRSTLNATHVIKGKAPEPLTITPKKITPRTPSHTPSGSRTPNANIKMSKSNFKLIF